MGSATLIAMDAARLPSEWESALGSVRTLASLGAMYDRVDALFEPSLGQSKAPTVFPSISEVFRAFHLVAPADARVVILGQDPYPQPNPVRFGEGIADGLCFSARGQDPPESLRRILYNLWVSGEIHMPPRDADLESWANSNVLLLNTALTVEPAATDARKRENLRRHQAVYADLMRAVLEMTSRLPAPPGYLLLGAPAGTFAKSIHRSATDQVVQIAHPSRRGSWPAPGDDPHPFSTINRFLGSRSIDWSLPPR